jgi:hypothetical protein
MVGALLAWTPSVNARSREKAGERHILGEDATIRAARMNARVAARAVAVRSSTPKQVARGLKLVGAAVTRTTATNRTPAATRAKTKAVTKMRAHAALAEALRSNVGKRVNGAVKPVGATAITELMG